MDVLLETTALKSVFFELKLERKREFLTEKFYKTLSFFVNVLIFVKQTILDAVAIFAATHQIYCKTACLHPADVSAFAQGARLPAMRRRRSDFFTTTGNKIQFFRVSNFLTNISVKAA